MHTLLQTKLYQPQIRGDLVSRQRLVELLDQGIDRKLILVSAPAGYGKTTLLSTWISQTDRRAAWLSLDEEDNDAACFLDYLIASLQTVLPGIGKEMPSLHGVSNPRPSKILLTPLLNEITRSSEDILLVLDDYHVISTQDVHEMMVFLLHHLPSNLHIAIASRTDPPIRMAKLRARGDLCEVRAADLRFTQDEAVDFFNHLEGLELYFADIKTLVDKTEGWIAGLQLAAISLQRHPDKGAFLRVFAGDDRHIADYLFEEVLHSLPENVQTFLLETSILDRLNASLCQAVTKQQDSASILSLLERANLFLIPLDGRRQWFRYHHLFADLLRLQLDKQHPSQIPLLHARASEWYENNDYLNLSILHAVKAADIPRLENLVRANTLGMLEIGESVTVDRWLSALPEDTVRNSLWLSVARGWTLMMTGKIEAAEEAVKNLGAFVSDPKTDPDQMKRALGQIAALQAYIADLMGDPAKVEAYARDALEKLSKDDQLAVAIASMMLATAYNRQGDTTKAEAALQGALATCETNPYSFAAIDSLCMLSMIQHLNGQLHESAATLRRALDLSNENLARGNRRFPITGLVHVYQSQLLYEWNRLEEGLKEVKQGLAWLEPCGYTDCVIVGLINEALIYHAMGEDVQAIKIIEKAKRVSRRIPYWYSRVVGTETWLRALQGESNEVADALHEQEAMLSQEPEIHRGMLYRYLAKIYLAQGRYPDAAQLLQRVVPLTDQQGSQDRLIRILVLQAVALFGLGDEDQALAHIQRAIELAKPGGYVRVFLDEGEPAAQLLYRAAQKGVHPAYCMRLLDEFSKHILRMDGISGESAELVEPLSQREIEVITYIARGCTNQEIARDLHLSLYTVKSHARNIFGKLGVKNRTEAVAKARLIGLLPQA